MTVSHASSITIREFNVSTDIEVTRQFVVDNLIHVSSKVYPKETIDNLINAWTSEKLQTVFQDPARTALVAETEEGVVGVVSLINSDIRTLFVKRQLHGCGIGRSLMQRIETIAKEKGITKFTLSSSIDAQGFYERLGYEAVGVGEGPKGKVIKMEKLVS